ncbi:MAG: hypothetical protein H6725_18585 [Sandaracinaceae bacterium]|nr:hypothetical protein [Sandaracinaceae bacterium]
MSSQSSLTRAPGLAALVLLALASTTPHAAAVPVRGLVGLPRDAGTATPPPATRRDHYWNVWAELLDPAPPRVTPEREVAVVLTGEGNPRARGCGYVIEGGDLLPRTLVVQANSRISLENRDGTAHEIYSETLPSLTPLRTAAGRAREIAVPDAGRWELRDRQYPQLEGFLVAVPDLVACASVNVRGEWRFADVPAGTYVLKVYRAGEEAHSAPLTVAANAREVIVDPILLTGN